MIKLKSFHIAKENIDKMKRQPIGMGENIYKWYDLQGVNIQNTQTALKVYQKATWLKNGQKIWIDIFPKKAYRWPTGTQKDTQHD